MGFFARAEVLLPRLCPLFLLTGMLGLGDPRSASGMVGSYHHCATDGNKRNWDWGPYRSGRGTQRVLSTNGEAQHHQPTWKEADLESPTSCGLLACAAPEDRASVKGLLTPNLSREQLPWGIMMVPPSRRTPSAVISASSRLRWSWW